MNENLLTKVLLDNTLFPQPNNFGFSKLNLGITDSDDVAVHIKKHFLLVPQIPNLEEYLKLMLDSFFRMARTLDLEIEKCRLQECKR